MKSILKIITLIIFLVFSANIASSKENFFDEALKMYQDKKYDDARYLLERNIVFNPKDAKSYLYLAKIYNFEKNEREELKNLKTTLLLDPDNEEAMYMLISIELEKSNFFEVKNLTKKFNVICSTLCEKVKSINERLENIEVKNESKQ